MNMASRKWPFVIRRCARCSREAAVVVAREDGSGGTDAACVEHLEWAFLTGVDEWSERKPTT